MNDEVQKNYRWSANPNGYCAGTAIELTFCVAFLVFGWQLSNVALVVVGCAKIVVSGGLFVFYWKLDAKWPVVTFATIEGFKSIVMFVLAIVVVAESQGEKYLAAAWFCSLCLLYGAIGLMSIGPQKAILGTSQKA